MKFMLNATVNLRRGWLKKINDLLLRSDLNTGASVFLADCELHR